MVKASANNHYKNGDFFDALECYKKAVSIFKIESITPEIRSNKEVYELLKTCFMNSSVCYIKMN